MKYRIVFYLDNNFNVDFLQLVRILLSKCIDRKQVLESVLGTLYAQTGMSYGIRYSEFIKTTIGKTLSSSW
jgi:hypothetical protein